MRCAGREAGRGDRGGRRARGAGQAFEKRRKRAEQWLKETESRGTQRGEEEAVGREGRGEGKEAAGGREEGGEGNEVRIQAAAGEGG